MVRISHSQCCQQDCFMEVCDDNDFSGVKLTGSTKNKHFLSGYGT